MYSHYTPSLKNWAFYDALYRYGGGGSIFYRYDGGGSVLYRYGGSGCIFYRYDGGGSVLYRYGGYCSLCNCASSYLRKYRCIRLPA